MGSEDLIYLLCLLASIAAGKYFRQLKNADTKRLATTSCGLLLVYLVSGWAIIHPIIMVLVNAAIILYSPVFLCHRVSFVFTFGYLLFHRTSHLFGLPQPNEFNNCIVMILALKMIGAATELQDYYTERRRKKDGNDSKSPGSLVLEEHPSLRDMWDYAFCYAGVLTGPYFKLRTYHDFIYSPYPAKVDYFQVAWNRCKYIPLYALVFFALDAYCPVTYALTDEFMTDHSFVYRIFYSNPVFTVFRMRFYVAFILSEMTCIMAGVGAYPSVSKPKSGLGPSDVEALDK